MVKKSKSVNMYETRISDGKSMILCYDEQTEKVIIAVSQRLTPEIMEGYRSISELNKGKGTNFKLSNNKKSLLSLMPSIMTSEDIFALKNFLIEALSSKNNPLRNI